jgi:hypothetical protein
MDEVSIFGTKQTAASRSILIQIRDGSLIAHLHAADESNETGEAK